MRKTHKFTKQHPDPKQMKPAASQSLSDEDYLFRNLGIKTPMFGSSSSTSTASQRVPKAKQSGACIRQSSTACEDFY
jgi:hypothetical protein